MVAVCAGKATFEYFGACDVGRCSTHAQKHHGKATWQGLAWATLSSDHLLSQVSAMGHASEARGGKAGIQVSCSTYQNGARKGWVCRLVSSPSCIAWLEPSRLTLLHLTHFTSHRWQATSSGWPAPTPRSPPPRHPSHDCAGGKERLARTHLLCVMQLILKHTNPAQGKGPVLHKAHAAPRPHCTLHTSSLQLCACPLLACMQMPPGATAATCDDYRLAVVTLLASVGYEPAAQLFLTSQRDIQCSFSAAPGAGPTVDLRVALGSENRVGAGRSWGGLRLTLGLEGRGWGRGRGWA